jgi:hypothetical protein
MVWRDYFVDAAFSVDVLPIEQQCAFVDSALQGIPEAINTDAELLGKLEGIRCKAFKRRMR